MKLSEIQKEIHETAVSKGWWEDDQTRSFGDITALFHSEISEAYEEYRNHKGITEIWYSGEGENKKPEGIPVELADCIIRILDYSEKMGINMEDVIRTKLAYNKTRSHRHGNKKA